MVSLCFSVNFLYDRVDFTLHHMICGKILDETYNIYAKNDQNDQKWRHYDVITHEKFFLKKFQYNFQNPRQISNQIDEVIFCHIMYSRLKTAKSAFFGDFPNSVIQNLYLVAEFHKKRVPAMFPPSPNILKWSKMFLGMSPNILKNKKLLPPQKIPRVLKFRFPYSYGISWSGPFYVIICTTKIYIWTKVI